MSISTEEKDRYLRETAIVLAREGFQTGKTDSDPPRHGHGLRTWHDGNGGGTE